ncbi:iron transport outer membrane receptor [Azorhizobium oxalatiphilum]|uniref:Iron transport outer membrane receptor n=1 Tax=Azorhizobium oxalatiphilum TaxID=980631 RepID=A0A917BQ48_9HYPH|nr:TonB-dependent siderophore receptor [Azorhizobium oxalatiphilum]GGF54639.1 iron transport outer membrane receptor [Azorhizobium oxalatiphilum]
MAASEPAPRMRNVTPAGAATASLAMAFSLLPGASEAQSVSTSSANAGTTAATPDALVLPTVTVNEQAGNTNDAPLSISRLPATVREMPQIVTVVPQQIIREQQATTLDQALRNVPGITLSTGEGNGGQSGSQFRIRGISSRGDIYSDGLRDFGVYNRDTFDTESVEVIKGPSGETFGVGNLGGIINQTMKKAHLGNSTSIDQGFASGGTTRTTIDTNYQINDTTAVRINGLYQNGYTADRDHTENGRSGLAIDLGFGLNTDTTWHLSYFLQHNDGTPDYGVPMAQGGDGVYRPLTEYNVPGYARSTSYIRSTDKDISNTNVFTSLFRKEFDSGLVVTNDTRLSIYDRDFSATNPAAVTTANLRNLMAGRNVALAYGAGGGMTYDQEGWGFQNVLAARYEFNTGFLRHKLLVGLDTIYQEDTRTLGTWTGRTSNQTVLNPNFFYPTATVAYGATVRDAHATDIGIFASDRVWFNDQWSVQGGLRWDYFSSTFDTTAATIDGGTQTSREWSPSASLIWEPNKQTMVYLSYARAYRPIGTDIAMAVGGVASEIPQEGNPYAPERSDSYELGTKIDLLNGRLGVTGAIFQIDKANSFTTDPTTGDIVVGFSEAGEGRRIRGIETGITGKVTDAWSVTLAYAYLDGIVTASAANEGNQAPGVSNNNVSLWTTYDLPGQFSFLPGRFQVGGGIQYASAYWADSGNTARIPETFSLDALIAYQQDHFRMSLNAYNLTDNLNYTSSFNAVRAVPSSGRTFMLNIGTTF